MTATVYRMSGAGNLFSLIDNRSKIISDEQKAKTAQLLSKASDLSNFIAEGVIFIEKSELYDFSADFYNPDGSSGMMCGNGGRCVVALAHKLNVFDKMESIFFEMSGEKYKADITGNNIDLYFPKAKIFNNLCPIQLVYEDELLEIEGTFIDNGSQHYCINIAELGLFNIEELDLETFGKKVRYHRNFQPNGTNCNVFQIIDNHTIKLRTYERGVEHETGACGTGAIASAYAAKALGAEFPIVVIPSSGIALEIKKIPHGNILSGPAELLETIEVEI